MSELPESWVSVLLDRIISTTKGKKPIELGDFDEHRQIPYNDIKAIEKRIFTKYTNGEKCTICKSEDVLIVWDGARFGWVGRGASGAVGSTLARIDTEIDKNYIYYYLKSKFREINTNPKGVGIPHVNPTVFYGFEFPLPPEPEQHRIVAKIEELFSKLDAGVNELKQAKNQLKRYRQSVLKSAVEGRLTADWRKEHNPEPADKLLERIQAERMEKLGSKYKAPEPVDTTDLPELPEGWVWSRIGDLSNKIHYGYTASSSNEPIGPKMLRITDIQNRMVNWDTVPYCEINQNDISKYNLIEGDLVFARTGATVGKSFLIKDDVPESVFASYLIRIILSEHIDNKYIYNFFQSLQYWKQIVEGQLGIGQPNVNATKLSELIIPIPPIEEQAKISEELEYTFSILDESERIIGTELKRAISLRQSILKKAFEGKLVPQDPNDEPASELLERIKAEKMELA